MCNCQRCPEHTEYKKPELPSERIKELYSNQWDYPEITDAIIAYLDEQFNSGVIGRIVKK